MTAPPPSASYMSACTHMTRARALLATRAPSCSALQCTHPQSNCVTPASSVLSYRKPLTRAPTRAVSSEALYPLNAGCNYCCTLGSGHVLIASIYASYWICAFIGSVVPKLQGRQLRARGRVTPDHDRDS